MQSSLELHLRVEFRNQYNRENSSKQITEIGETSAADYPRTLAVGLDRFGQTVGRVAKWIGAEDTGNTIEDHFKEREEENRKELTPAWQVEQQKTFLSDEKGEFFGEGSTSLPKIVGSIIESAPSMAVGMGTGMVVSQWLIRLGMGAGLAGIIGGGIGEGGTAAVESAKDIEDIILNAPAKQLSQSEEFKKIFADMPDNFSEDDKFNMARRQLATDTALWGAVKVGGATALLGAPSGYGIGKLIGGEGGKTLLGTIAKQGALEAAQEAPQSAYEAYTTNKVVKDNVDPSRDLKAGTGEAAMGGFITGGAMGIGFSGGVHHNVSASQNLKQDPISHDQPTDLMSDPELEPDTDAKAEEQPSPASPEITLNSKGNPFAPKGAEIAARRKSEQTGNEFKPVEISSGEWGIQEVAEESVEEVAEDLDPSNFDDNSEAFGQEEGEFTTHPDYDPLEAEWSERQQAGSPQEDFVSDRGNPRGFAPETGAPEQFKAEPDLEQKINEEMAMREGSLSAPFAEPEFQSPETEVPLAPTPLEESSSFDSVADQKPSIEAAAHEAATSPLNNLPEPSQAQKEAGNYKKGTARILGMGITFENPAGSERSGTDESGKPWSIQMQHHYGYIKGTEGKDGDHLDLFIKNGVDVAEAETKPFFVVDQINEDGSFDEHKILSGFATEQEARDGYHSNYEEGWQGLGAITEMSPDQFKAWVKGGKTKRAISYKSPKQVIPEGVNVAQNGKPYARKGINLVVSNLIKKGKNVEPVQLDKEGKQWGWREVVDAGPVMDAGSQKVIREKLLKAVPDRNYDNMMEHADTLIDNEGFTTDDVYEVISQIDEEVAKDPAADELVSNPYKLAEQEVKPEGVNPDEKKKVVSDEVRFTKSSDKKSSSFSTVAEVKSAISKLENAAVNAGQTEIVQSMEDLPKHVQNEFNKSDGSGVLEAAYADGKVYLVADNISSGNRAIQLWMHEQGVHHGLRAFFKESILNNFLDLTHKGAVQTAEYKDIVKRYGLNLDKVSDQRIAAEEYLARIGEKVKEGEALDRKERTVWQKLIDMFRTWLMRIGYNMNSVMGYEEIKDIITRVVTWTVHGSVGERASSSQEPAIAYSQKESAGLEYGRKVVEATKKWSRIVDDALHGKPNRRGILQMGETPQLLVELGAPKLPLTMRQTSFEKIAGIKPDKRSGHIHELTEQQIKHLYQEIADPVAVIQPHKSKFEVFVSMLEDGKPVMVVLDIDATEGRVDVNSVATAFGKERGFAKMVGAASRGALKYMDTKRVNALEDRSDNLKSGEPTAVRVLKTRSGNKIRFPGDVVKPILPKGTVLFSRAEATKSSSPAGISKVEMDADSVLKSAVGKIGSEKVSLLDKVKTLKKDFKDGFEQGVFDKFASLKKLDADAGVKNVEDSAYIATRMTTSLSSNLTAIMEHGTPVWNEGAMDVDTSSEGLMKIMEPVIGELDRFMYWMVGNRADKLKGEGRENLFNEGEIEALKGLGKGRMETFLKVRKKYIDFKNSVLDFAEEAGVIDPEGRKLWEHDEYIPFYRIKEEETVSKPQAGGKGVASRRSGIKKLKGGESNIGDPFENIIINFSHLIDASLKNHATDLAVTNMVKTGVAAKADPAFKPEYVQPQQSATALRKVFGDKDAVWNLGEKEKSQILTIFQSAKPVGNDIIHVLRNGKAEYYQVEDRLLLEALTGMNEEALGGVAMKGARWFKRVLTSSVTASPEFMLRNIIRDTVSTWAINEKAGFKPGLSTATGVIKAWKNDKDAIAIMAAGASFSGGHSLGHDPAAAKLLLKKFAKAGIKPESVLDTPKKLSEFISKGWDQWNRVGSAAENSTRVSIYGGMKKRGATHLEAAYEAKDIMDFSMRGSFSTMRFLCETVPFFGARVQGLHKLGRAYSENPTAFLKKAGLIAAASSALFLANAGNSDYDELEDWEKDAYYHFFTPRGHFRLPKPFEVGFLCGTIPERITEQFVTETEIKELGERVWWGLTQTFAVGLPQIIAPLYEQGANRNTFTDRPIVPMRLQRLAPGEQSDAYTSSALTQLGRKLNVSPKRMEHLVRGYFGTVGTYVLTMSDYLVNKFSDMPDGPAMRLEDMPLIKAVYRGNSPRRTRFESELYDLMREADTLYSTIKTVAQDGRKDEAKDLWKDKRNRKLLGVRALVFNRLRRALSEMSRRANAIHKSKDLTPKQKRDELDKLRENRNKVVKNIMNGVAKDLN